MKKVNSFEEFWKLCGESSGKLTISKVNVRGVRTVPFKDAEQKRQYMESFRQKKCEEKEFEREKMLDMVNRVISAQNPSDINGLLLIDTDLTYYKSFGDFRKDHPAAQFPEFQEYQSDQKEWLFERKSDRVKAVQRALAYLTEFEQAKTEQWRKLFPKFFSKYEQKEEGEN